MKISYKDGVYFHIPTMYCGTRMIDKQERRNLPDDRKNHSA